jgi:hypothetical protein
MGFYSCASTYSASFASFWTTSAGEKDGRAWSPLYANAASAASTAAPFHLTTASLNTVGGFQASGLPSTNSAAATSSSGPGSSSGSGLPINIGKKKSNAGAIAGGVVGGLAALGAIAFGIIFFMLRKKKSKDVNEKNAAATAASTFPNGAGAPGNPHNGAPGVPAGVMPMAAPVYDPTQPRPNQPAYFPPGQFPPNDPRYSYYNPGKDGISVASYPVGGPPPPDATYAAKFGPVEPLPQSPAAPPYSSPQQMRNVPSPVSTPPPPPSNVYEVPAGVQIAARQENQPSPLAGTAVPAVPAQVPAAYPGQAPYAPSHQTEPVELGTTYAIPTHDAQGRPIFEAGSG